MSPIDAIAFDLDGTLIDSAGGIAHALNTALAGAGLAPFDPRTVRTWIGDGPDALIARALAASAIAPNAVRGLAARLRDAFDAATLDAPMIGSRVFDGVGGVLAVLAPRHRLVVVTNKPTPLARAVLEAAGLLPFLSGVHGADTAAQRKPSPLLIRQAADALGLSAQRLLMIGDAPVDIASAHAAGAQAAWAGWGYGHAPVPMPSAVWTLQTPHDLLDRLPAAAGLAAETEDPRRAPCPQAENPR
ncbi:MAG: HAD-IA family hydrolase [Burkholderiales bacterium]